MCRRKGYSYLKIDLIVGERKCAFEGCNALEFRSTGYCLRHKDDHPWLPPQEVSPDSVQKAVPQVRAHLEEVASHQQAVEEEFFAGPIGWAIVLIAWFFPPILFLLIPIYLFKRATSTDDVGTSDRNPEANSQRNEDMVATVENSDQSQLPWWVSGEENQE